MTRIISVSAFSLGIVVVLWMGASFVGANLLALLVVGLIAAAYTAGFAELWRYQQATDSLQRALREAASAVEDVEEWLRSLHPSLRNAVRQRIHGEHLGLPAPVLTPYLVGLLVMLGLLGTFIGMVATLQGAVTALEGSTELEAIRTGLAAPIHGLSMAFATSVAGVAASAMLGLVSALSRRQRLAVSRELDAEMSGAFREFSLSYQRRQAYRAMQNQAQALPAAAARLEELAGHVDSMVGRLAEQLSGNQEQFHRSVQQRYEGLADAVGRSLKENLGDAGRLAAENMQRVLEPFLSQLGAEQRAAQGHLAATMEEQLQRLSTGFQETSAAVSSAWQEGLAAHQRRGADQAAQLQADCQSLAQGLSATAESLLSQMASRNEEWLQAEQQRGRDHMEEWRHYLQQHAVELGEASARIAQSGERTVLEVGDKVDVLLSRSDALVAAREASEGQLQRRQQQHFETLMAAVTGQLEHLHEAEQQRGEAAVARLEDLQNLAAQRLAELGAALETPMQQLIQTASETPRAAAEVIAELRSQISNNIERDNALLEERGQLMEKFNQLATALERSSRAQSESVQTLLSHSARNLDELHARFKQQLAQDTGELRSLIDHFAASSGELASLGEAFTAAVGQFSQSNTEMREKLAELQQSLESVGARNDQQMEYYLLQARDIIDQNLLNQQALLAQLRGASGEVAASGD